MPWIVEYVHQVINELGYGSIRIAVKCDKAPDLQLLRRQVSARRSAATVPIDVETRESKGNRAVERAVRTWQGQFLTLKCHLETSIDLVLPESHPVLTWCAFLAAGVLNRSVVKSHDVTVFEYACGHRTKVALTRCGEVVPWRAKRHSG